MAKLSLQLGIGRSVADGDHSLISSRNARMVHSHFNDIERNSLSACVYQTDEVQYLGISEPLLVRPTHGRLSTKLVPSALLSSDDDDDDAVGVAHCGG